jgi:hypothetical protein
MVIGASVNVQATGSSAATAPRTAASQATIIHGHLADLESIMTSPPTGPAGNTTS